MEHPAYYVQCTPDKWTTFVPSKSSSFIQLVSISELYMMDDVPSKNDSVTGMFIYPVVHLSGVPLYTYMYVI